jgi:hypothetical protein
MLLRTGKAALYRVWSETQAGFASIRGSPPDLYKVLLLKVRSSACASLHCLVHQNDPGHLLTARMLSRHDTDAPSLVSRRRTPSGIVAFLLRISVFRHGILAVVGRLHTRIYCPYPSMLMC